jgi:nicotinamide-nucleotide amidase
LTGRGAQRPRVAIVATGSELVRGDRRDLNGPFLAGEVLRRGLEPVKITIVGDDASELERAIRDGLTHDLCLLSGGLGPTHDDRTIELLARAAGTGLRVDAGLEAEIEGVSRAVAERLRRPYGDFRQGVTKQATLPEGARSVGLAGTAPAVVLETGGSVAAALPGPPAELQRLWPNVLASEPVQRVLERAQTPERRVLRFFGVSESAVAKALADAGGDGDGVVATICARDFEIHVDLFVDPGAAERGAELEARLLGPLERHLFARDERSVSEHVLALCRARGWTLATAESCTGGLVAARLTDVPGSSDVFLGAVVAYANAVKARELGVAQETLERHGAVSPETAAAMAAGARVRLGADVAVSVTGIAGPDGGTAEKPVGLVHIHAESPESSRGLEFSFPGDRGSIRTRSTVVALHHLRRLLSHDRHRDE